GASPVPRRISPSLGPDDSVVWSPDATRLAWVSGRQSVVWRGAQAVLPEEAVARFEGPVRLWSWVPDGQSIVVGRRDQTTGWDLWIQPVYGDGDPGLHTASPFNDVQAAVSPNGRWIAYASDESGEYEIYLDTFPDAAASRR